MLAHGKFTSNPFRMPIMTRSRRTAITFALSLVGLASAAVPSHAMRHLKLSRSTPAADTTVTSPPDAIRLWLSEPTNAKVSRITLVSEKGLAIRLGALTRGADNDAPLMAPIPTPLPVGRYTVKWKAMSNDGHVVNGTFAFRVGAAK